VSHGLKTTLQLLSTTENEAAVTVLIPALDSPEQSIREGALRAILDRRSLVGQREILRRMHVLDDRWKEIINERRGRMAHALRDAVLGSDPQMCANGCQAILWFREYDLIPALINAFEDDANPHAGLAAETLLSLAELLYDELAGPRDLHPRRDPQLVRRNVTGSLELSVLRYSRHRRVEPIEAYLMLTGRDNATLKMILLDPLHGSYLAVIDSLTHSPRSGVMRLLLSFLEDPHAPSAALTALAHRTDRKFIDHLLRKIGSEPSVHAKFNLKHVESFTWLKGETSLLANLDDAGQHSAVQLIVASGMPRQAVFLVLAQLATRGKLGGRRAAVSALAAFNGAEANVICLKALEDEDPQVRALALGQLRQRGIPGALSTLIEHIDSPFPVIRNAVRDSLSEFTFKRYVAAFDMLEDEVRRTTGALVKKVDPATIPGLREELHSPSRRRRTRALNVTAVLDLAPVLEDALMELLADEDHLIRVEAARTLARCNSEEVREALRRAASDSSVAVQEAATKSLREIALRNPPPPDAVKTGVAAKPRAVPKSAASNVGSGMPRGIGPFPNSAGIVPMMEETP
jgi:HEAT repeat protein